MNEQFLSCTYQSCDSANNLGGRANSAAWLCGTHYRLGPQSLAWGNWPQRGYLLVIRLACCKTAVVTSQERVTAVSLICIRPWSGQDRPIDRNVAGRVYITWGPRISCADSWNKDFDCLCNWSMVRTMGYIPKVSKVKKEELVLH